MKRYKKSGRKNPKSRPPKKGKQKAFFARTAAQQKNGAVPIFSEQPRFTVFNEEWFNFKACYAGATVKSKVFVAS